MRLFSYCIPIDDGAAPNPYWDMCTLAICKPVIRRVANGGDWIAAVGKDVGGEDYSGKLVYAMKISRIMSHQKYYKYCKMMLPDKIPDIKHLDYRRRVGDCIYDFDADGNGMLMPSVHTEQNRETDLGGMNVLLSDHYYYFGKNAVDIPPKFETIIIQGQGHQSKKNEPVKNEFIHWIETNFEMKKLYGDPQVKISLDKVGESADSSCNIRCKSNREDEEFSYSSDRLPLSHWNYFLALESDLKGISRHIEIHDANFKTFSISLTQLLLASCSEIDVILKEIIKLTSLSKAEKIHEFFPIFCEKVPLLFGKTVNLPLYQIQLAPFKDWKAGQPPAWWTSYNKVKHHRNTHYSEANLLNCLNALGALYILIYELIRLYQGKSDSEYSSNLIYKHLQPQQELFRLEGEEMWREIAEGKRNLFNK